MPLSQRQQQPRRQKFSADPRAALARVVDASRESYAALSRMLDRPDHYLRRFVLYGHPLALRADEHTRLANFFGISERQLGIRDLWVPRD